MALHRGVRSKCKVERFVTVEVRSKASQSVLSLVYIEVTGDVEVVSFLDFVDQRCTLDQQCLVCGAVDDESKKLSGLHGDDPESSCRGQL